MRKQTQPSVVNIVDRTVGTEAVSQYLANLDRGLGYWLPFVTGPAVDPTTNAAEHALREPIMLRKIIGTLRTESGRQTRETLLSPTQPGVSSSAIRPGNYIALPERRRDRRSRQFLRYRPDRVNRYRSFSSMGACLVLLPRVNTKFEFSRANLR